MKANVKGKTAAERLQAYWDRNEAERKRIRELIEKGG